MADKSNFDFLKEHDPVFGDNYCVRFDDNYLDRLTNI